MKSKGAIIKRRCPICKELKIGLQENGICSECNKVQDILLKMDQAIQEFHR